MNLDQPIDAYCERVDPTLFAEPLNLLTNLAFMVAAILNWPGRCRLGPVRFVRVLCALVFITGVGSALFHSVATRWAQIADVTPIGLFMVSYMGFVAHVMWRLRALWTWACVAGLLGVLALGALLPPEPFNGSNLYFGAAVALWISAIVQRRRRHPSGPPLVGAAAVFMVALVMRSIDLWVCPAFPVGTHFLWHVLNGLLCFLALRAARTYLETPSEKAASPSY